MVPLLNLSLSPLLDLQVSVWRREASGHDQEARRALVDRGWDDHRTKDRRAARFQPHADPRDARSPVPRLLPKVRSMSPHLVGRRWKRHRSFDPSQNIRAVRSCCSQASMPAHAALPRSRRLAQEGSPLPPPTGPAIERLRRSRRSFLACHFSIICPRYRQANATRRYRFRLRLYPRVLANLHHVLSGIPGGRSKVPIYRITGI